MLKKTMLTLTVLGSLAVALPAHARDRDVNHHEVQHTQHYADNRHNSHQPRVVFYFSGHHQPQHYDYGYRHHYRHQNHHYRNHDRQHYRHYERRHGEHHERRHGHH